MERLESPPPEKRLRSPKNWLLEKKSSSCAALPPGIGIAAKTRKTMSAPSTNSTRLRSDLSESSSMSFWAKVVMGLCNRAPRLFDFCTSSARDFEPRDRKFFGKLAVAQNFFCSSLRFKSAFGKSLRVYRVAGGKEPLKRREVDNRRLVLDALKAVTAALREFFKHFADSGHHFVAGAGLLPLGAAARGLALARASAAANTLLLAIF